MSQNKPSLLPADATHAEAEEIQDLFFKNARTFQDFTALTPESMEVIYMVAYNHYNTGKYEEAEKVFRLLTTLNHFERKYWKGLAAAREGLKQHEPALQCYGYLGMMDPMDPYPAFKAAQCLLALGRPKDAEAGLNAAIFSSADKEEHAELHAQAQGLLELVQAAARKDAATPSTPSAS
jgi:type III secretion system low calcium response chaperone LcrH/SycD